MIKTNNKGILLVVSGPSGAGKGTVCKELMKNNSNIWMSVSMTTRLPRPGEKDGVDYFFVTKEEFEKRINNKEFLEYAVYNDNYYGTPRDKINDYLDKGYDVILEIEIEGALQVKEIWPESLFIFILPPTMNTLKERLKKRGTEDENKILSRFQRAYKEINEITKYNYVVVNDEVEKASKKMQAILLAEKCSVNRIEEVYLNNDEESIHELLIDDKVFNNKNH